MQKKHTRPTRTRPCTHTTWPASKMQTGTQYLLTLRHPQPPPAARRKREHQNNAKQVTCSLDSPLPAWTALAKDDTVLMTLIQAPEKLNLQTPFSPLPSLYLCQCADPGPEPRPTLDTRCSTKCRPNLSPSNVHRPPNALRSPHASLPFACRFCLCSSTPTLLERRPRQ